MNQNKRELNSAVSPETEDRQLLEEALSVLKATQELLGKTQKSHEQPAKSEAKEIDLVELMYHILAKIKWVIIAALIGAMLAGVKAFVLDVPTYKATAKLYILGRDSVAVLSDLQIGTLLTSDYKEVFKTWEVHEMVREELELDYSYGRLQSMLEVANPDDTRILYISITHEDAQLATDIANAYAKAAKQFIQQTMDTKEPNVFSLALEPATAIGMSKTKTVAMGFMLGITAALCIIVLRFILDDRPRTPDDIQSSAGIPTLAVVPHHSEKTYAKDKDNEPIPSSVGMEISRLPKLEFACNEAMNTLATAISFCGDDIHSILLTSCYAEEGKSFISMQLMCTFASLGYKVVLIDTDLRRSKHISTYGIRFRKGKKAGLAHYLSGQCDMNNIIYQTNIENAYMIPIGKEVESSLQLLSSPKVGLMMEKLREQFDIILVDTAPAGMIVDALKMAKHCDGALISVTYNKGKKKDIDELVSQLNNAGCPVLGAVLNDVKMDSFTNRKYYYKSERYSTYYKEQ